MKNRCMFGAFLLVMFCVSCKALLCVHSLTVDDISWEGALSPTLSNEQLRSVIHALVEFEKGNASKQDEELVKEIFETRNLSNFIFLVHYLNLNTKNEPYDVDFKCVDFDYVGSNFLNGKPLISKENIDNFETTIISKNKIEGNFTFNEKIVADGALRFSGRCLFTAIMVGDKWIVDRIVISRKNSDDIDSGLLVFERIPNSHPGPR